MAIRLAILGSCLIILGLLNLGGYGNITAAVGGVALAGAAIAWVINRKAPGTRH